MRRRKYKQKYLVEIIDTFFLVLVVGLIVIEPGGAHEVAATPDAFRALVNETIFNFALCYVVLNTATSAKNAGNSYYGLAIGFTVVVGAYAGGAISGGAYNPAVACGITMMGLSTTGNIWIFLVGNFWGRHARGVRL